MAHLPSGLVPHSRKVCSLYKRVLRHLESWLVHLEETRYHSVVTRAEFDKNKNIKDLRVAKKLMQDVENRLFIERHYQYKKFPESPGGCAYERDPIPPDWILDYWHPMEKAMYPKYFATREQRKKEYEEFYRKQYGEPPAQSEHH